RIGLQRVKIRALFARVRAYSTGGGNHLFLLLYLCMFLLLCLFLCIYGDIFGYIVSTLVSISVSIVSPVLSPALSPLFIRIIRFTADHVCVVCEDKLSLFSEGQKPQLLEEFDALGDGRGWEPLRIPADSLQVVGDD